MGIKILRSGMLSTIQDLGRIGFRKDGVIVSGAMDALALRIGNLLVGNPEGEAAIECTLLGTKILFEADQLIALTGGDLSPSINGKPVKMWRPLFVPAGAILSFGNAVRGCRTYLVFYGGLAIPEILGSRSTYLKAGFGGWEGRAVQQGDSIPFNVAYKTGPANFNWSFDLKLYPDLTDPTIRVMEGPEYHLFSETSRNDLVTREFYLTKESDRMGYRLQGATLQLNDPVEMLSSAVTFGTVQVTNDGNPIVLMADHQTTGGYPRIAQVITADLSKLAQLQSGQFISFKLVTLADAHDALKQREAQLTQLKQTLTFKYGN